MRKIQVNVAGVSTSVTEDKLTLKPNGDYEKHYNADMSLDMDTINAEAIQKMIADGEALVAGFIQAEVDKFNEANKTKFTDIHAMGSYKDSTSYPHASACKARWDWNEAVWMAARAKQAQAVADGLSEEEFIALLPKFV